MVYDGLKKGKYILLRAIEINDAEFTAKLRGDAELCKHIHQVDASIIGQREYIRNQRDEKGDYYFLIETLNEKPLGTIALYHFNNDSAEIGRWVSYGNAFENIEAVILLHDIAYEELGLNIVYTCTNVVNNTVISFWKRFGGDDNYIEEQSDFTAYKNVISKDTYYKKIRPKMTKLIRYDY